MVERLPGYERLYKSIRTVSIQPEAHRPEWWNKFRKSAELYSRSGKFVGADRIVVPDDQILKGLFADCEIETRGDHGTSLSVILCHFTSRLASPYFRRACQSTAGNLDELPVEKPSLVTPSVVKMDSGLAKGKTLGELRETSIRGRIQ